MKTDESGSTLERLFSGQLLAVLATNGPAGPYLSLVAFAASPDRRELYFATPRNTRKWKNLEGESRVALLLDDRPGGQADFSRSAAVTITGTAQELAGEERDAALALYKARHPGLAEFAAAPGSAFMKVTVSDTYLANGFK